MNKYLRYLQTEILKFFFSLIFLICFRSNFWNIYSSYHRAPKRWKKEIWNQYMHKNSASISIDATFSTPLILPHGVSGIFISQSAVVGSNVVIFQQVTIGANTIQDSKSYGAPIIGNNVYIGAGAKVIGAAVVEDNVRIGANAVVVKNVPFNSLVIPAENVVIHKEMLMDNSFTPYLS